jgi:hypothetical protein
VVTAASKGVAGASIVYTFETNDLNGGVKGNRDF